MTRQVEREQSFGLVSPPYASDRRELLQDLRRNSTRKYSIAFVTTGSVNVRGRSWRGKKVVQNDQDFRVQDGFANATILFNGEKKPTHARVPLLLSSEGSGMDRLNRCGVGRIRRKPRLLFRALVRSVLTA